MGYIIKAPTGGGGGGDATAANQDTQINQLTELSTIPSVLKDNDDFSVFANSTQRSVFKDNNTKESVFLNVNQESVFIDPATSNSVFIGSLNGISVFETSTQKTVAELLDQLNVNVNDQTDKFVKNTEPLSTTVVTSFNSATLAGVATLLQTFLQANPSISIINISFSSGGAAQHDVLVTYNP